MKWYSTEKFMPGIGVGYVIALVLNCDECEFIYMALYLDGEWEFWDEEYWPEERRKEGLKITHWTYMPRF